MSDGDVQKRQQWPAGTITRDSVSKYRHWNNRGITTETPTVFGTEISLLAERFGYFQAPKSSVKREIIYR